MWWNRMHRFGNLIVGEVPPGAKEQRWAQRNGFVMGPKLIIRALGPRVTYRLVSVVDSTEWVEHDEHMGAA